jgi:magnesium chelatase family protein
MPARFQLVAAMNPCQCGFLGHPSRGCACSPRQLQLYRSRLSGPLLDRIDLRASVSALTFAELEGGSGEPTAALSARAALARQRQIDRQGRVNAGLGPSDLRTVVRIDAAARRILARAVDRFGLTGRAYDRVLRVARTLADLAGESNVRHLDIAEALQLRGDDAAAYFASKNS